MHQVFSKQAGRHVVPTAAVHRIKQGRAQTPKRQQGLTLAEFSLVLAAGAVLIVIAVFVYQGVQRRSQINDTVQSTIGIIANLQATFGQSNRYAFATTVNAVGSSVIPKRLQDASGSSASDIYGGAITVAPSTLTQAGDAADLSLADIPLEQCVDIVNSTEAQARVLKVGATVVKPKNGTLDSNALNSACIAAPRSVITWTIGRS